VGPQFTDNNIGSFIQNKIGTSFQNNTVGNGFSGNTISDSFSGNTIGDNFVQNNISASFAGNTIGNGFEDNIIASGFSSNAINSGFYNNKIGPSFSGNTNILNGFQNNEISTNSVSMTDFNTATHVYGTYSCTIFRNSSGNLKLSYIELSSLGGKDIVQYRGINS
jgi:hypothetical protein